MPLVPNTNDIGPGSIVIGGATIPSALMELLLVDELVPGSPPSYEICKKLYAYHPLGGKMTDGPIALAQSQEREITVPSGPEEELVEAFQKEWDITGNVGADDIIHQAASLSRVYGISTLVLMSDKIDQDKLIPADRLHGLDLFYNVLDPLNTAGSLVLNQDPTKSDFMKPRQVTMRGMPVHMSRVVVTMNEQPIWIEWTDSAFGFVGRSVFQRALYPLKSYIQSMLTDQFVMEKAGVLIHKAKGPGSIIDRITAAFFQLKRTLIGGTKTGNVVTIGHDEELTSIDLTNLQQAAEYARNNIVTNIATSADMPACVLREETYTQGFGEGTEDAKRVSAWAGRIRIKYDPLYNFFNEIVMRRAWSPAFYETIQRKYPNDYGNVPFETAFFQWHNSFKATWPNLLQEPDSEKSKVDDVILKAAIAAFEVLTPALDPENKAATAMWLADILNERKMMFSTPLLLDEEAIASYEPPVMPKEPFNEPETYRDSAVMKYLKRRERADANLLAAHEGDSTGTALRKAIAAEIDAINLYEKMAEQTDDEGVRKAILDIAKEEKTHIGEFEALLLKIDPEQKRELKAGHDEVRGDDEGEHWITMNGRHVQVDKGGNIIDKKIAAQISRSKSEVPSAFKEFAKKSKSKITPTKHPPGNMLEIRAGVKEDFYEDLMPAVEQMFEGAKGTENEHAAGYIKSSIEGAAWDKKYSVCVQLDAKDDIVGAVRMHPISDSIRIETIGGLGKGAGKACLISAVKQSIKSDKGGSITLTSLSDIKTLNWYIKMGFESKKGGRPYEFWLSPEAAKKLMGVP